MPLSLLVRQHPAMLAHLREQAASEPLRHPGRFAIRLRPLDAGQASLTPAQASLWKQLADGPKPLSHLYTGPAAERALGRLVDRGLVLVSAFTPSDAAHILGLQQGWSKEAAELGAEIFRRNFAHGTWQPPADAAGFARQVVEQVVRQSAQVILASAIADEEHVGPRDWGKLGRRLMDRAVEGQREKPPLIDVQLRLGLPLVAIGAPVGAYYPEVAKRLHTRLVIPPHADVTNAVGAVAGGVVQTAEALITQPTEGIFRLHVASGVEDFGDLERAAAHARTLVEAQARAQAERGGAGEVQVSTDRKDKVVRDKGGFQIFIESRVSATAFGRPRLAL